jgi:hypothetical protein
VEVIVSLSPPAIPRGIIVERGVVIGGLMICGSFLLAALLNRSAMEEAPAPPPIAPVTTVAPLGAPTSGVEIQPGSDSCTEAEIRVEAQSSVTQTEQPAPSCSDPD